MSLCCNTLRLLESEGPPARNPLLCKRESRSTPAIFSSVLVHLASFGIVLLTVFALLPAARGTVFQPGPFDFAAYATGTGCGAITVSGNAYTDSFDSSRGTYAQTKQLNNGHIGVTGNATLNGTVTVNGSIFAVNTAVGQCRNGAPGITLSGKAAATGGYIQLASAPVFTTPPLVTPGSQKYQFTSNASLPPGSYGDITVTGNKTLTFSPGTYNINSLTLTSNSTLTINPAGQVVINIAGNNVSMALDLTGGGLSNPSGIPLNLQILYRGTAGIDVSGGPSSYAILYAPNSATALRGGSDWYGAMVVGTLDDSGGTAIHFDRALAVPPSISALVSPPANSAGWNKTDVTVTFTCSDPAVGISSCTSPVQGTKEGANQSVAGTAVNREGLSTSTSVSLNIDKTPPVLAITSPVNGVTINPGSISVSGTATDALSGIVSVTCQGVAAALSGSSFNCAVPIVAGSNTISVQVTDKAGNTTPASMVVLGGPATLTQVNPNTGPQGKQNLAVIITGQSTHFAQASSIASFGAGITVASLTVNSTASATAVLNIDPGTPTGARNVTVTTGSESVTLNNGFTVTSGVPLLLSVNPNSGKQGQQNLPVTLAGQFTHFQQA